MPKRVVVTGAGGFVGQALLKALDGRGVEVIATDARKPPDAHEPSARWVVGDLGDPEVLRALFADGASAVVHLAAVPGGAAESDPDLSRRVNLDAALDLIDAAARVGGSRRFVFASTIAVYGDPLPDEGVDDLTPLKPKMIYGAHKAMMETWIAAMSRRGAIDGVSLRLPGIVARPRGAAGMKSAFMSDIFHAMLARESFVAPVSPDATMWLMSTAQVTQNLLHALEVEATLLPESRAVTLPAVRARMRDLAGEAACAAGHDEAAVRYEPDAALEAGFGAQPPLQTAAANRAGFRHDGDVRALVEKAMAALTSV